jgi:hypothetical protein
MGEAVRQRVHALRRRPLTRSELWTITKLVEAVMGRVLGPDPHRNVAANQEEARRKIEGNNRSEGRLSARTEGESDARPDGSGPP